MTRIIVDRFHYKKHTCSAFFDADYYKSYDGQRSTSAESIDSQLEKSISLLRRVSGENYVHFLAARFAMINISAKFRQHHGKVDLEDEDVSNFFMEFYDCECEICINPQQTKIEDQIPMFAEESGDQY